MDPHVRTVILEATGAGDLIEAETIQSLWSGYGSIDRYVLTGSEIDTVVVKHVRLPDRGNHPRGWNTDNSHRRKLRSYQVETAWYEAWAWHCDAHCRIPRCLALEHRDDEVLMVLEDLDSSGYATRKSRVTQSEMLVCLNWLAHFHATFMGEKPDGLWDIGTYWHLDTRPDELAVMEDGELKQAAPVIDRILNEAPFRTFVHGDAKLANFCFSDDGTGVAAVDFQYTGGGCGMKDVAYFIGSCLDESECARREAALLDAYFSALKNALALHRPQIDATAVESAWRPLYSVAWTDFYRFLQGWSPGHWKIHGYSERLADEVVRRLTAEAPDQA
jgi:aminoglycoside phosphotransferase (APT) family kinase protein